MVLHYFLQFSGIFYDRRGAGGSTFESFVRNLERTHRVLVLYVGGESELPLLPAKVLWLLLLRIVGGLSD